MRLDPASHRHLESFLREHFNLPTLALPQIEIYGGAFGSFVRKFLRVGAITLGRRIFVSREFFGRDAAGRVTLPGWLLAHEAVHVWQFTSEGMLRFLASYLRSYFRALRASGRWDGAARMGAYLAIEAERAARAAEEAYKVWCAGTDERDDDSRRRPFA